MAPITITETELEHPLKAKDCIESSTLSLTHRAKELNKNENYYREFNMDTYKKSLKPEPNFLKPIREWEQRMGFLTPLRWTNIIIIFSLHIIAISWLVNFIVMGRRTHILTVLFGYLSGQIAGFGVTGGVHRMWCHRSYKAKLPLQCLLVLCYSVAGQNTIYEWVRDHRVHHKYSETTADPHDANRGFFFSHVGWLMMKKHPDVVKKGNAMDLSDITSDPLIQFHNRYFWVFKIMLCWVIPTLINAMWDTWEIAFMTHCIIRYTASLNLTWSVNSFAHLWGNKPYDKNIMPSENWGVSAVTMGEGWHNYHHTFPWDYKAAELGMSLNPTASLINFFAKIGWAYDLKQASPALIESVANARGDLDYKHEVSYNLN